MVGPNEEVEALKTKIVSTLWAECQKSPVFYNQESIDRLTKTAMEFVNQHVPIDVPYDAISYEYDPEASTLRVIVHPPIKEISFTLQPPA